MGKVDMKPFKKALNMIWPSCTAEDEIDMAAFVHSMCEGSLYAECGIPYSFPSYALKKENEEEYTRQVELYMQAQKKYRNEVLKSIGYKHIKKEGGEGDGSEYCYGVFELGGKTYRAEYLYFSYCGYDYDHILDTLREVKPKKVTITVYE